jgi:hypothetical protein
MRSLRRILLAIAVSTAVVSLLAPGVPAQAEISRRVTILAPGLTLTRISDSSGPYKIRALTVDPTRAVMVNVALSGIAFGTFAKTSTMAGTHGAIAAVNGDFATWPARPVHTFAKGGHLVATGDPGASFAVSEDEQHAFADRVFPTIRAMVPASGQTFGVASWNTGRPGAGLIAGYTPVGGTVVNPPSSACSARLATDGDVRWGAGRTGVARDYTVVAQACQEPPMPRRGDVILATGRSSTGAAANAIRALTPGTVVSLTWSLGWADVATSIGGMPLLVQNGKVGGNVYCGGSFCDPNPRTGIGYTATGKILLVTVDGRQPGWSVGMTMTRFAQAMIGLGAVNAVNLDGGGSTTMWARGQGLVNHPSDWSGERAVSSAVLVLPTTRSNFSTFAEPAAPVAGPSAQVTWRLMTSDPGSTGGLMDAVTSGALGPASWVSPQDERIGDHFRASSLASRTNRR